MKAGCYSEDRNVNLLKTNKPPPPKKKERIRVMDVLWLWCATSPSIHKLYKSLLLPKTKMLCHGSGHVWVHQ